MGKKKLFWCASLVAAVLVLIGASLFFLQKENVAFVDEQYSARVDRVEVTLVFFKTGEYRLTTNELVREGRYDMSVGYKNDERAVLYVLNSEKSEGEQMHYVRLSNEPDSIYILDSAKEVITGSKLHAIE